MFFYENTWMIKSFDFKNLRKLTMTFCTEKIEEIDYSKFECLEVLDLTFLDDNRIHIISKSLKALILNFSPRFSSIVDDNIRIKIPMLNHFSIISMNSLIEPIQKNFEILLFHLYKLDNIQHFIFDDVFGIYPKNLALLLANLYQLTKLEISFRDIYHSESNSILESIREMKNLNSFKLGLRNYQMKTTELESLFMTLANFKNLQKLKIYLISTEANDKFLTQLLTQVRDLNLLKIMKVRLKCSFHPKKLIQFLNEIETIQNLTQVKLEFKMKDYLTKPQINYINYLNIRRKWDVKYFH